MNASRTSTFRRTAFAAAVLVAVSTALTGCTLDFIPDGGEKPQSTTQKKEPRAAKPEPQTGEGSTSGADPSEPGAAAPESRTDYAALVDRTISCPGGTLEIADVSSIIALDSDCTDITVSGAGTVLLASNVERLTVIGVDNTVFAAQLGSLEVSGHGNVVTWEGGKPTVSNTGINNQLNPAG